MQTLYALSRDKDAATSLAQKDYTTLVEQSYKLYLFHLYLVRKIIIQSENDEIQRKVKYLPTVEDKKFTAILANNKISDSLLNNAELDREFEKREVMQLAGDEDILKKCYLNFSRQESYVAYFSKSEWTNSDHMDIMLSLYKFLIKDELFREITEDRFSNFVDDESLIAGALKKTIKSFPDHGPFFREYLPDSDTVEEFGLELLDKSIRLKEDLEAIIQSRLINWEMDRVAVIDMILLQMAAVELLHFPSIPIKVTLNEYIDLSKMYSTDKSKDFVNGLLDKLITDLTAEGKINKQGRGLIG